MKIKSGVSAFLITAAVLLSAFAAGGLFPFGWGTISWCDMNQQAIPLLCCFKDILAGRDGAFINFANGAGMNLYGVIFFFLSSPFSFLAAFVHKADIPFLMNIIVILKLCTAGLTAGYVFARLFPKNGFGINSVLGAAYALCGYGMLFYQNVMWLDVMYLFPIIFLGVYLLARESRPLTLAVSLSLCVVFNYYISFMVFLFVICFFGLFALFYRNADREIYVNLGICGGLSLLVSAIVWVPSFLQYTASGRSSSVLQELKNSAFFAVTDTTVPLLLCSGIILAVLILTLPSLASADRQFKFLLVLFLALCVPIFIEPVNLMWHTGSYMSFPARYGFMTIFVGLCIAAKTVADINTAKKSNYIAVGVTLTAIALLGAYMVIYTNKNLPELSNYVQTLWGDKYSFKGLAFLCMVAVLLYFTVFVMTKRRLFTKRVAALLLCGVLAVEGFCSVNVYMVSAKEKLGLYNYQSFIEAEDFADKQGFYRVNMSSKLIDANMTGAAGFNSISHYTSLNDKTFMEAAKMLGYSGYWMETGNWGGSIISDALLSVGYTVYSEGDSFALEENPYYLGLGLKVDEIESELSHKNRLAALGKAFGKMTNTENSVTEYAPDSVKNCSYYKTDDLHYINYFGTDGKINYKIKVTDKQILYFDCYNGFSNRLVEEINDSFEIHVNGVLITESYPTQRNNGLVKLGAFENETVDITLKALKGLECSSFGVFGVNENAVKKAVNKTECASLTTDSGTIKGEIKSAGKYFISIPYRDDYKIILNGEKVAYTKALSGFVAVNLAEAGEIKITATPKGFTLGAAATVIGIILLFFYAVLYKRINALNKNFKNIVYGVFLGVFVSFVLLVYIIPIIVNLSDFMI